MKKKTGLMLGALVACAVAVFVWIVSPSVVTAEAMMDDPPEERPIAELLNAREVTRSEMHNVLALHFDQSSYWEVRAGFRLLVLESDAEVVVIGRARLNDETILTLGQLVLEDDVVEKGLLFNDSEEPAQLAVVSSDMEVWSSFTLDPDTMIVVGQFVTGTWLVEPHNSNCPQSLCDPGQVPCCWRDNGQNPHCACMTLAECNQKPCVHNCPSGGENATECDIKKKGCSVKCAPGYHACCTKDDAQKGKCICVPQGECPTNNSGTCTIPEPTPDPYRLVLIDP